MINGMQRLNFGSALTGYDESEGIKREPYTVDKSESFDLAKHGELSTNEYLQYLHYIQVLADNKIGTASFPKANPTKIDNSKLIEIIENQDLDLE
jgi:hypothetical protein